MQRPDQFVQGQDRGALEMLRMALVTILSREMRLKFFEEDQALEILRVALVTMLAREMRLKFFKSTKLWRCCECR